MNIFKRTLLYILLLLVPMLPLFASSSFQQIKTLHHTIIFEETYEKEAQIVASFADEVFETLTQELSYTPKRRIPVILTGTTSWANGYFSTFPSKVTLFITSDESLFLGARSSSWLYSLFVHELTHYIHLTNRVGPAAFFEPIFGPEVTVMNMPFMPGWWIEGITTYNETHFAPGGRGDNQRFLSILRSAIHDDSMWSLAKGSYSSVLGPSGRIYLTGYLMVEYIIRTYGYDAFNEINRLFTQFPFFGISGAIQKVTTFSAEEIFQKALDEMKLEEPQESKPLSETLLSSTLLAKGEHTLWISQYTLDEGLSIYTIDEMDDLHHIAKRIKTPSDAPIAIDESLSTLYFLFQHYDYTDSAVLTNAPIGYKDIWSYNWETQVYNQITENEKFAHIALHPDKKKIVATEIVSDRYRLVEIDLATKEKSIVVDVVDTSLYFPQYSPSGDSIVVVMVKQGASSLILITNGEVTPLIEFTPFEIRSPRFIDEHHISFTSDLDEPFSLYTIDIDTKGITLNYRAQFGILDTIIGDKKVYYQSYYKGETSIFTADKSSLTSIERVFPQTSPQLPFEIGTQEYQTSPYTDFPRFSLWLPLPYAEGDQSSNKENQILPGVWTFWRSLLQKHTIEGQIGYSIIDQLIRSNITYQYNPGPFTLTLQGNLNDPYFRDDYRKSDIGLTVSLPLWSNQKPQGTSSLSAAFKGSYFYSEIIERLNLATSISHTYRSVSAPLDSFGRFSAQTSYALQDIVTLPIGSHNLFSFAYIGISIPSLISHHTIKGEIEGAYSHMGLFSNILTPSSILPPQYLSVAGEDGFGKMNLTLSYQIPIVPLDIPLLWGGLQEIDVTIHAMSSFYLDNQGPFWSEEILWGAQGSATYTLGSGITFNPFIAFEISSKTADYAVRFGIDTGLIY